MISDVAFWKLQKSGALQVFTKEMQYQLEDIGRQAAVVPAAIP